MEQVSIGLIGLGTVGTGVARILTENAERIAHRAGKAIRWKWAVVRELEKSAASRSTAFGSRARSPA